MIYFASHPAQYRVIQTPSYLFMTITKYVNLNDYIGPTRQGKLTSGNTEEEVRAERIVVTADTEIKMTFCFI